MSGYSILFPGKEAETEVKKSRFIASVLRVSSESEAKEFVSKVKKTYFDARHHCFALRIGVPERVIEKSFDDHEPSGSAGLPILNVMRAMDIYDACLVVTRYFGGTLLGTGGLKRAYSAAAKAALESSHIQSVTDGFLVSTRVSYAFSDTLKREAEAKGISIYKETYSEDVCLSFIVPEAMLNTFKERVLSLSQGKSSLNSIRRISYYMDPKPIIYRSFSDD